MIRKLVLVAAGLGWGVFVFLASVYFTFPSDAALTRARYEFTKIAKEMDFQASKVSPWMGTGLKLSDFKLLKQEKTRRRARAGETSDASARAKVVFSCDALAARLRLFPFVMGRKDVGFDADLYEGTISGHVGLSDDRTVVASEIEDIDLSAVPVSGDDFDISLGGILTGNVDLDVSSADATDSSGDARLEIQDLVLKSGKIMGFDLPSEQKFTEARIAFKVEEGKAKVTEGRLVGDLLDATFEGEITLNKKIIRSRPRITVVFTVAETFDNLLKLAPGPRDARDDEGKYHYLVTGTLEHPRFYADRAKTGRRSHTDRGTTVRSPALGGGAVEDAEEAGTTDDERKASREERIRERRERLKERRDRMRQGQDEGAEPGPRGGRTPEDGPPMDEPPMDQQPYRRPREEHVQQVPPEDYPPEDRMEPERNPQEEDPYPEEEGDN